uniref:Uncharacterized protein n=1 Tax=Arundo donax TaxID=35708 RepID=A0A0A9AY41_ARUDO
MSLLFCFLHFFFHCFLT